MLKIFKMYSYVASVMMIIITYGHKILKAHIV